MLLVIVALMALLWTKLKRNFTLNSNSCTNTHVPMPMLFYSRILKCDQYNNKSTENSCASKLSSTVPGELLGGARQMEYTGGHKSPHAGAPALI